MSGWRVVLKARVQDTEEHDERFNAGWNAAMEYVAAAPEPDWEALATEVLHTNAYDRCPTGGEIFRLSAALKATFWSKP